VMPSIDLSSRYPLRREIMELLKHHAALTVMEAVTRLPYAPSSIGKAMRDLRNAGLINCWLEKAGNGNAKAHYHLPQAPKVYDGPRISATTYLWWHPTGTEPQRIQGIER
jgi:DNA-binding transcriptional ArsR family regulator